uniref:hypothetical protein n=1 Tax=Gemmiger formicilis TaxID=745368 RepID=UPI0040292BAA
KIVNNRECEVFALRTKIKRRGAFYMRPDGLAQGTRPRVDMESAPTMNLRYLLFLIYSLLFVK